MKHISILFLEENEEKIGLISKKIESLNYKVVSACVKDKNSFENEVKSKKWDLVIIDSCAGISPVEAITILRNNSKDVVCVVISDKLDIPLTVNAIKEGANECLEKVESKDFLPRLEKVLKEVENGVSEISIDKIFWLDEFDEYEEFLSIIDWEYNIIKANKYTMKRLGINQLPVKCYKVYHHMDKPPHFCPHTKCKNGKPETIEIFEKSLNTFLIIRCIPIFESGNFLGCFQQCCEVGKDKLSEVIYTQNISETKNQSKRLDTIFLHLSRAQTHSLSAEPLKNTRPEEFNEIVRIFAEILDLALEQKVYKVEYQLSEKLKKVADLLGRLDACPRDVIDIYGAVMKEKVKDEKIIKSHAYREEGMVLLIELMGYLAAYYRKYSVGLRIPGGIKIIRE
ncbi:MAG: response regulator [Thermoplasmata archaeon]